ncbi:MAG: nucleoside recognition protein [Lachnospiraceae bacterium]|jgi:spore maturation protein A|nr:nucleoside recognition protein [Lachnospiraceae bacterium]
MLNYIWALMLLIGIVYGALNGNMKAITDGALNAAGEAVTLCITMLGVMALWSGLMEIARASGLIERMTKGLGWFISFMFPNIPKGHKSREYISTNIIANILGLGWACTPAGLKAMEELNRLEQERTGREPTVASKEMCTFLILNISSLQLIPVNMIIYRGQYGSANAAAVIAPAIIATLFSTIVAVIYCKIKEKVSN